MAAALQYSTQQVETESALLRFVVRVLDNQLYNNSQQTEQMEFGLYPAAEEDGCITLLRGSPAALIMVASREPSIRI